MEAKHFAYLVQTQKKEYLKEHEEVRLPSVRITLYEVTERERKEQEAKKKTESCGRLLVH